MLLVGTSSISLFIIVVAIVVAVVVVIIVVVVGFVGLVLEVASYKLLKYRIGFAVVAGQNIKRCLLACLM